MLRHRQSGENDCGSTAGTHSCAGHTTVNYDGGDWKHAAEGTCEKMGGKLEPFKGQGTPAKSS